MGRAPYHGPQSLREWSQWARNRAANDNDVIIVVSGETGSGKSSLALLMARKLQEEKFVCEMQVLWDVASLLQRARDIGEGKVLIIDEAMVAGGNRRRAMSNDNIETQNHLNTCRVFHQIVLFLAPNFADLDISIQNRVKWNFHVTGRGEFDAYEVIPVGGPKSRSTYSQLRFSDTFPDPKAAAPELWAEYEHAKLSYSFKGADPKKTLKEARIKEMVTQLQEIDTGERVGMG